MLSMAKDDIVNFNFSMPAMLAEEFRRIGDVHGERNKLRFAVGGAAILKLLEMPEAERREFIERVAGARHFPDSIERMIEEAKGRAVDNDPNVASTGLEGPSEGDRGKRDKPPSRPTPHAPHRNRKPQSK